MKISPILFSSIFEKKSKRQENRKGANHASPVWANPGISDKKQASTIEIALNELTKVKFKQNDVLYMHTIGAKPLFKDGSEAVKWIKDNGVKILYADFSNKKVHACLNYNEDKGFMILINSNYKNDCSFADALAISEAIFHECGHGKDFDNQNSIQEELDCMSLNVLAHRFYESEYPDIFKQENSFLFREGVSLYPTLFYDFYKTGLKKRVCDKYGYLQTGDNKHPATKMANEIKGLYGENNKSFNTS